jgi:hypothetical protein
MESLVPRTPRQRYSKQDFVEDYWDEIYGMFGSVMQYCDKQGYPFFQNLTIDDWVDIVTRYSHIREPRY